MDFESGLRQTNPTNYTLSSPMWHIEVLVLSGFHATPVDEEFKEYRLQWLSQAFI